MDRETLYLDNDEEITSVVDKLKGTEHNSIDLVIPKDSIILQGVVNLKLLKRQAETIGKEITIVTQDKVGSKLATQIGIPVVAKIGQVPKEVTMSESEKPNFSEDDIEMKETKDEAPIPNEEDELLEDTDEVVEPVVAKEKVTDLPKDELKEASRKVKMAKWKKVALASGFLALVLFVAAYIYIPLANVSIKIVANREKVDISFKADKAYKEVDAGAEVIPANLVTEEKEVTEKYPATGKKKVGEKASGTATLFNNGYDSDPVTIIAGTRLVTESGLIFKTNSNATIPGSYLDKGLIVSTSVDVTVTADQVGEAYNIAEAKSLSVPAIGNSKVYAKSKSAFTGGSSRDVIFVTQADVNKAKEEIAKKAQEELRSAIAQKIKDNQRLLEEAVKIEEISVEPSVAVNGEAKEFDLVGKYRGTAVTFSENDLKKLAETVLGDKIGSTKEIVETDTLINTTSFVEADYEKGILSARLSGEAFIAPRLDQEKIKVDLSGENEAKARAYLSEIEGIESAEIKFFPAFYKRMPRLKDHIYLKMEITKK